VAIPDFTPRLLVPLTPAAALKRFAEVSVPALGPGFLGFAARWAWLHYLWAFAEPEGGKNLRLSADAERLAGRRKGLLTEQLGIALGLSVMERHLKHRRPGARIVTVDADVAMAAGRAGGFNLSLLAKGGVRPDYFLLREASAGTLEIFALECKGRSSRLGVKELVTAARQLRGVSVAGSGSSAPPPGVVVASAFRSGEIETEAFDPEGDEAWAGPVAARGSERPVAERRRSLDLVTDMAGFRRLLLDIDEATVLAIGGRSPDEATRRSSPREVGELGAFEGTSYRFRLSSSAEAEVFHGVEVGVLEAFSSRNDKRIRGAQSAWAERVAGGREGRQDYGETDLSTVDEERLEAYTVDERGLLLQMRVRRDGSYARSLEAPFSRFS